MRYFRSTPAVYVAVCAQLDAAYGYPNAQTKTERTLPAVNQLPADSAGRVYLAISAEHCDYILPGQMLPELLASGNVQEITQAQYAAVLPAVNP
ncbi:MAG: hypothetical protein ACO3VO_00010 [Ilumatobacteraceae bacterium]